MMRILHLRILTSPAYTAAAMAICMQVWPKQIPAIPEVTAKVILIDLEILVLTAWDLRLRLPWCSHLADFLQEWCPWALILIWWGWVMDTILIWWATTIHIANMDTILIWAILGITTLLGVIGTNTTAHITTITTIILDRATTTTAPFGEAIKMQAHPVVDLWIQVTAELLQTTAHLQVPAAEHQATEAQQVLMDEVLALLGAATAALPAVQVLRLTPLGVEVAVQVLHGAAVPGVLQVEAVHQVAVEFLVVLAEEDNSTYFWILLWISFLPLLCFFRYVKIFPHKMN